MMTTGMIIGGGMMPKLTKQDFINFSKAEKKIYEGAMELLPTYLLHTFQIASIDQEIHAYDMEIVDDVIIFTGTETWRFGGREDYCYTIPKSYVLDEWRRWRGCSTMRLESNPQKKLNAVRKSEKLPEGKNGPSFLKN